MLERFLAVSVTVSVAASEPFLSRSWVENGGKLGFWDADMPFLELHELKPVTASCKRAENTFKAPCCVSSPIVVMVWR